MGVAYLLDISPVAHRLYTCSWSSNSALPLHFLQVAPLSITVQNMVFSVKGYFVFILLTKKNLLVSYWIVSSIFASKLRLQQMHEKIKQQKRWLQKGLPVGAKVKM